MSSQYAYVTLLYGDSPAFVNTLVFGRSLLHTRSAYDRVLLYRKDVPKRQLDPLSRYFTRFVEVDELPIAQGIVSDRCVARFKGVFDKLHALQLTEYRKVLLLDSDMIVLKNLDHVFAFHAPAATPLDPEFFVSSNVPLPTARIRERFQMGHSYINAGIMLLEPSVEDFSAILQDIAPGSGRNYSFDLPEQTYLSGFYAEKWHSLSYLYNYRPDFIADKKGPISYALTCETNVDDVFVVHYVGGLKPYHYIRARHMVEQVELRLLERRLLDEIQGRKISPLAAPASKAYEQYSYFWRLWFAAYAEVEHELLSAGVAIWELYDFTVNWIDEERPRLS